MQSFGCDAAGLSHVSQGIYSSTARALDLLYYGGDGGRIRGEQDVKGHGLLELVVLRQSPQIQRHRGRTGAAADFDQIILPGGQPRIRVKRLFRVGVRRGLDGCKHKTGLKEVALRASGQGRGEPEHGGEPGFCVRSEERRVGKECSSRWAPY